MTIARSNALLLRDPDTSQSSQRSRQQRLPHRRLLIALLIFLTLAACSSTAFQDPDVQLANDIRELQARLVELQKKTVVAEVEILRLREKVAELEAAREREVITRPAREPTPAAQNRVSSSQPVTTAPRPAPIETTDLESAPPFADSAATEQPLQREPRSPIETPAREAAVATPTERATTPSREGTDEPEPLPLAAQALYDRGFTEYHEGRYLEAESSLQQFLEGFPDSEWSDNALYWIGEARYARRDYRGALAAFRETTNRFPLGNKVPDALLKSGQSLEQLGDTASARQSYREIARRFPDTATALIARERLDQLNP